MPRRVFDVVDIVPETLQSDDVVDVLPDDAARPGMPAMKPITTSFLRFIPEQLRVSVATAARSSRDCRPRPRSPARSS